MRQDAGQRQEMRNFLKTSSKSQSRFLMESMEQDCWMKRVRVQEIPA